MNKLKTMIAGWLRAAADKLDPKPVQTAGCNTIYFPPGTYRIENYTAQDKFSGQK